LQGDLRQIERFGDLPQNDGCGNLGCNCLGRATGNL
jgi:hypothetical protein